MRTALQKVLSLRPTNAACRLDPRSRLPLLNPRDLVRALEGRPAALLTAMVPARDAIAGLLRAARGGDAVLGLACPHPLAHREGAVRFFEAVRRAAEEVDHRRPLFLQAGPVRVRSLEPQAMDHLASEIYGYVDAGFSMLSFDASTLPLEDGVAALAEIAQPAVERELAIEVAAPSEAGDPAQEGALREFLRQLATRGVEPRFVRFSSHHFSPPGPSGQEGEIDAVSVRSALDAARDRGADLSVAESKASLRRVSEWVAAGVKKLEVGEPFGQLVLQAMPPELREKLEGMTARGEASLAELLGREDDPLGEADRAQRDRVEALCYGEAEELLRAAGALRSSSRAIDFLAERSGY